MFYSLLVVIVAPFSLLWMTYNPLVQTFLARMTASYLSERMNTVVKIDGLYITPRLDLNLEGILVLDQLSDTLFNAENVFVDMKSFRLRQSRKTFSVNSISVSGASFALIKGQNDSVYSYSFIRDHFESESTETSNDTIHGHTEWQVSLGGIILKNVRFRYFNNNRKNKKRGMDYSHLDIFVYVLKMDDLKIQNDTFNFHIEDTE